MGVAKVDRSSQLRQKVIADFTYVDGYLDLLPAWSRRRRRARELRASAYERLATANGVLQVAKTPGEIQRAQPLLVEAQQMLTACRAVDRSRRRAGTGVVDQRARDAFDANRRRAWARVSCGKRSKTGRIGRQCQ